MSPVIVRPEARLVVSRAEFDRFAAALERRRFARSVPAGVLAEQFAVSIAGFTLARSLFTLKISAEYATDDPGCVVQAILHQASVSTLPIMLKATFTAAVTNGNPSLLTHVFARKEHSVSNGPSSLLYTATLGLSNEIVEDEALLIRQAEALDTLLQRLTNEAQLAPFVALALEAREMAADLQAVCNRHTNTITTWALEATTDIILRLNRIYEKEVDRISLDPGIVAAMEAVADK